MFQESATNLHDIPVDLGRKWLDSFDTVLSDCDGKAANWICHRFDLLISAILFCV